MLRHISAFVQHYIWGMGSMLDMISKFFAPYRLVHFVMAIPVTGHAKIAD